MRFADKSTFLDHKVIVTVEKKKGGSKSFAIALNFSVGLYYKIVCLFDTLHDTSNQEQQKNIIAEIAAMILHSADKSITIDWVQDNLSEQRQVTLIDNILQMVNQLIEADYLKIPNIDVKPSFEGKQPKERREQKENIRRLQDMLNKYRDYNLMDDISLVMIKTHNNYKDVMNMPILIFRNLVKTIIVNENRADDNYNLAYLKYELEKYKNRMNHGEAEEKPTQTNGADVKKFHQLFG